MLCTNRNLRFYSASCYRADHLITRLREDGNTLWELFSRTVLNNPKGKFLGHRLREQQQQQQQQHSSPRLAQHQSQQQQQQHQEPIYSKYVWSTFEEVAQEVTAFAAGLLSYGVSFGVDKCESNNSSNNNNINETTTRGIGKKRGIGLYVRNCHEYVVAELASYKLCTYNSAIYDTITEQDAAIIVAHSDAAVLLCSQQTLHHVFSFAHQCPLLSVCVCTDAIGADYLMLWESRYPKVRLVYYGDVLVRGRASAVTFDGVPKPSESGLSFVSYCTI
jgi:hypothetical protein